MNILIRDMEPAQLLDIFDKAGVRFNENGETIRFEIFHDDVEPVRHGMWKILRPRSLRLDRRDSLFECSECGANRIRRTGEILNYCPCCGAKMDGEEQENE